MMPLKYSKIAGILAAIATLLTPLPLFISSLLQPILDGSKWFPIPGLYGEFQTMIIIIGTVFSYPLLLITFPLFILGFKEIFANMKDKRFLKVPHILIIASILYYGSFLILLFLQGNENPLAFFGIVEIILRIFFAAALLIFGIGLCRLGSIVHAKKMGILLIIASALNIIFMALSFAMNSAPFYPLPESAGKIWGIISYIIDYGIVLLTVYAYILGVKILSEIKKK